MKKNKVLKAKAYKLKGNFKPLTYMLPSRHTSRSPLLHFDGTSNRPLRYAKNQKSPFEDEQDGNVVLEPIIFEDGMLAVPKENPVLQEFLYLHPQRDMVFEEIDNERDAQEDLEIINYEVDALIAAKECGIDTMEIMCRVLLGSNPEKLSTAELKRDILLYARNYPEEFLDALNDPMVKIQNLVAKCFEQNKLGLRNKGKDVYFNLKTNKTKLLTVPFGENPQYIVASYLNSDDGLETYKLLDKVINE